MPGSLASQIHVFEKALVAIIALFLLMSSSSLSFLNGDGKSVSSGAHFSNLLIESKNNPKEDARINNDIGKSKGSEEDMKLKDDSDKPAKGSGDSGSGSNNNGQRVFDAKAALLEIRALKPMVIFSKSYCPYSMKLKKLIAENYQITPEPMIVELDKHQFGAELQEYLGEISGRKTVPNVVIGKSVESKGGCDDFLELHNKGKLLDKLKIWGDNNLDVKKIGPPSNA
ncbi:uncharacterized protein KQ657_001324 [Scheffersomyces spartinae]|uniref:Glutaredoxin domain-containing protein n=1 Tax=Scheffersomyces spartinae TaxID=45513 RepID=A0A9P8AHU5_9ASCO|nr:uncharacterized protein KQ657_001324 [Scheffersomyces spartinae]KAG7192867.1 hypothetical protein KQ657_001324 [Scheffersomyces spartinae]